VAAQDLWDLARPVMGVHPVIHVSSMLPNYGKHKLNSLAVTIQARLALTWGPRPRRPRRAGAVLFEDVTVQSRSLRQAGLVARSHEALAPKWHTPHDLP